MRHIQERRTTLDDVVRNQQAARQRRPNGCISRSTCSAVGTAVLRSVPGAVAAGHVARCHRPVLPARQGPVSRSSLRDAEQHDAVTLAYAAELVKPLRTGRSRAWCTSALLRLRGAAAAIANRHHASKRERKCVRTVDQLATCTAYSLGRSSLLSVLTASSLRLCPQLAESGLTWESTPARGNLIDVASS